MSLQLLVILVPVLFGMMGFAIDLGRLWMVRGELHQAASAMALAAAGQMGPTMPLMGVPAANQALNEANGNTYNFGSTAIPEGTITCFNSIDAATANERVAQATQAKAWLATLESGARSSRAAR